MDSRAGIEQVVAEHGLRPVAVILSHGHLDHMWSVLPVCDGYDIPAWIHPDDRALLADPWAGVSGETRMMFASVVGAADFAEPSDVRELTDGASLEIAGMTFTADHAPGHTPGSTAFRMMDTGAEPLMLSGDLLFAGSIGRTDLPGGDNAAMLDSLARVVLHPARRDAGAARARRDHDDRRRAARQPVPAGPGRARHALAGAGA